MTYHSEFEVVCLRKSVLEVAMVAYQEFRARCGPVNKQVRELVNQLRCSLVYAELAPFGLSCH